MRDEVAEKLADVSRYTLQLSNPAYGSMKDNIRQTRSIAAQLVCGDAAQLNPGTNLPPDESQWVRINCVNGDLSPASVYAVTSEPGD
jgi:hypothetical protein